MVAKVKADLMGLVNRIFRNESIYILVLIFSIVLIPTSCKKDSSQYYVKYQIDSKTVYSGAKLNVEVRNESNNTVTYSVNQRELWEVIVGPVEEGFTAYMRAEDPAAYEYLRLYPSIYISKDNGPFTLEKTDLSEDYRYEVELSYRIE